MNIRRVLSEKNKDLVKIHMNKILDISAKNSKPKLPELYSILNPDTNSLSPSAKSNGARLVSEIIVTNHINSKGKLSTTRGNLSDLLIKYLLPRSIRVIRKKIREISYEIVWALARREPKNAYLLLELHPAKKMGNTLSPETTRKIITLYLITIYLNWSCMITQKTKAKPKVIGAIRRKKFLFLLIGTTTSFLNSFTASAKGCRIPKKPTLLGPFRS